MAETETGIQENVAGLLCYILGWITGIVFLIIIVFGAITILGIIFSFIPVLRWFMPWIIWVIGLILWIVLMIKAYHGEKYKLPVSGDMAERWAG